MLKFKYPKIGNRCYNKHIYLVSLFELFSIKIHHNNSELI